MTANYNDSRGSVGGRSNDGYNWETAEMMVIVKVIAVAVTSATLVTLKIAMVMAEV